MVQQGLGGRYARAATRRGAVARDGEDASYPAARATVQAGLRSYALTKAEQLRFSGAAPEYREARCGRGAAAAAAGRRAEGLGRFVFSSAVVTSGWDVFVGKHKFASAGGTLPHARVAAAPVCSLLLLLLPLLLGLSAGMSCWASGMPTSLASSLSRTA